MKTYLLAAAAIVFSVAANASGPAQQSAQDAIQMTERGAAFLKANGRDEFVRRVNDKDPAFAQGSMYIYLRDFNDGTNIAHPYNKAIVGRNLDDVPDTNGKLYRREIMAVAARDGKGWVDYMYRNPDNNKIEPKTSYVLRVGDVVLVTGIYKK